MGKYHDQHYLSRSSRNDQRSGKRHQAIIFPTIENGDPPGKVWFSPLYHHIHERSRNNRTSLPWEKSIRPKDIGIRVIIVGATGPVV